MRAVRQCPGPRARFAGGQGGPQDGRDSVTGSEPGARAPCWPGAGAGSVILRAEAASPSSGGQDVDQ